jgi:hypothetical protein
MAPPAGNSQGGFQSGLYSFFWQCRHHRRWPRWFSRAKSCSGSASKRASLTRRRLDWSLDSFGAIEYARPGMQGQLQLVASDQTAPPKRQAILVLGMHRSGTSALGGAINALGVAAPKTLLAPRPDNPRGFFESAALADAHDALLESTGSCWDDWRQFDSGIGSSIAEQHRQTIKAVLIDEFDDAPLIFIKDPRMCRFVPFTLSVLAQLNISPVAILPIRNPLEVAHSLKRRNGFSLSKSLLLWLRHVLDAEYNSRRLPRYFLPYERFLNDWRSYMDRAAERINLSWPARSDLSAERIENFLTADLYHEKASLEDLQNHPNTTSLARETYEILTAIAANGENEDLLNRLDLIRAKFNNDCEMFGKVLEQEFAVRRLRSKLEAQVALAAEFEQKSFGFPTLSGRHFAAARPITLHRDSVVPMHIRPTAQTKSGPVERDNLATARDSLIDAREGMVASEIFRLKVERDTLVSSFRSQIAERDKLANERAELAVAIQRLTTERDNLIKLVAAREAECIRLTHLSAARELEIQRERNLLTTSLATVVAERNGLAATCNSLEITRNIMLSSRSWRLTAPLRFLRRLFG